MNVRHRKVDLRFFEAFIPITPSASLKYSYTRQRYYNICFKILRVCVTLNIFGKSFI